jgi:hypothetical protein
MQTRTALTGMLVSLVLLTGASARLAAQKPIPLDPGIGGNSLHPRGLQAGDIIVSTTSSKLVSENIRRVSGAEVSHAMLCIQADEKNPLVIEAVSPKVRRVGLDSALEGATVAVAFRHPEIDDAKLQKIVKFAADQVGKEYNTKGVVRQLLCYTSDKLCYFPSAGDKWYCSELVLGAYGNASLKILLTTDSKQAPGELANSKTSVLRYVGHLRAP